MCHGPREYREVSGKEDGICLRSDYGDMAWARTDPLRRRGSFGDRSMTHRTVGRDPANSKDAGAGVHAPRVAAARILRRNLFSTSAVPVPSSVYITICPQLAKAAVRAADEGAGFDPHRLSSA